MRCETTSILFDWTFDGPVNRITQTSDTVTLQYGQLGSRARSIWIRRASATSSRAARVTRSAAGRTTCSSSTRSALRPACCRRRSCTATQLHVVERFALDPRALTSRGPTPPRIRLFTDQYKGSDTIGVADLGYAPDKCEELTFVDFSNDGTAPGGVARRRCPERPAHPRRPRPRLPLHPPPLRRPLRPHRPQPRPRRGGNLGNGGTDQRLVSCSGPDSQFFLDGDITGGAQKRGHKSAAHTLRGNSCRSSDFDSCRSPSRWAVARRRGGRGKAVRAGHRRDAAEAGSRRLADVAPHAGQLGLQPAEPDQQEQRREAEAGLEPRGMGTGVQEATPLVYDGVMYIPNSGDFIQAFDAQDRRPLWEYKRALREGVTGGTNRNIAIWGTTLIDASADNMMYAIDARTGKLVWETPVLEPTLPARASSGPIIANGKVITGRQCQPDGDQRLLRHHRARREDRQGVLAHAHDPAPGRARRRNLGRRADGAALARRHVDGAELRPRARPDLHRHVGHDPGAEVHPRRQRQAAPLSQLDARARRATPARSFGTTSIWSITGISIIRSSGCSSIPRSRPIRARSPGSIRSCARARRAR